MTLAAVRTPDERFARLPDFGYEPRYLALPVAPSLRLHYVDEGPRDAATFLCLHGEPSWSFLYRKMLPVFLASGARVVAPDFFGFGRSDKPTDEAIYTWDFHRRTLVDLIETLDLSRITLVCQDWGGLLGLTLPMDMPERFARLLVMNTALATGLVPPTEGFVAWRAYVASHPDIEVGALLKRAAPELRDDEVAAYDAPFVDASYKMGVRRFPQIVPVTPEMEGAEVSRRAALWLNGSWAGQTFMAVGARDPVLGVPVMRALRDIIRGCPEPLVLEDAGHFVQERGDIIARAALDAWS
jgi:pimeloyl-ACP methyl ester carboxylesterase